MAWIDYRFDTDQLSLRRNETKQAALPAATAATIRNARTLIDLANPTPFLTLTARLLPWLTALAAILLLFALYQSAVAPDDYQRAATVKTTLIHVPNTW